ncbi:four helix bundle protein [Candidatus Shapirobacteria bacterium]|nr:four helix bundle protein [Candidatus Shapirobacteria bacterium]
MYNLSVGERIFGIRERSFRFGVRIIKLTVSLPKNAAGFAIGGQVVRSGTGIGANIEEAQNASSKREFIRGMTIALKEARETEYWLKLIAESGLIPKDRLEDLIEENRELIRILITIIKNAKRGEKL